MKSRMVEMSGVRLAGLLGLLALGSASGCHQDTARSTQLQLDRAVATYLIQQATPSDALQAPDGLWYRRQRLIRNPHWRLIAAASLNESTRARLTFEYDVCYTQPTADRSRAQHDVDFVLHAPLGLREEFRQRQVELVCQAGRWRLPGEATD